MTTLILVGALASCTLMLGLWLLRIRHRNFSYVDIGWSVNFVLLALICGFLGTGDPIRRLLICSMFTLWSTRLALHLAHRIIGEPEEGRYVQLRQEWHDKGYLNLRFLAFFQLQALLNVILSLPMFLAAVNPEPTPHAIEIAGAIIWAIGVCGEGIADRQLKNFKRSTANRGKVCEVGLWNWSRHPNYFFEWIVWIGYAMFALGSPHGWLSLGLPFLMLHFLFNVTGIKATEQQALRSKGEAYRRYQRSVSAFIPKPRKKEPV